MGKQDSPWGSILTRRPRIPNKNQGSHHTVKTNDLGVALGEASFGLRVLYERVRTSSGASPKSRLATLVLSRDAVNPGLRTLSPKLFVGARRRGTVMWPKVRKVWEHGAVTRLRGGRWVDDNRRWIAFHGPYGERQGDSWWMCEAPPGWADSESSSESLGMMCIVLEG